MKRYIMWLMASASMLMSGCFYQYPVVIHDPGAQPVIINNPPYPQYYVDQDRMHQRITAAEQKNTELTTLTLDQQRQLAILQAKADECKKYIVQPRMVVRREVLLPRSRAIHVINLIRRHEYLRGNPPTYNDLVFLEAERAALLAPMVYVDRSAGYIQSFSNGYEWVAYPSYP